MTKLSIKAVASNLLGFAARRNSAPENIMDTHRIFFVHIMKTGGVSLNTMMRSFYPRDEIYPNQRGRDRIVPYMSVSQLRELDADAKSHIRYLAGHFPYCVRELFQGPMFCMSIFRDPVARTISNLKQSRTRDQNFKSRNIVEIYENPQYFERFVDNMQTRCFAHELTDDLNSVFKPRVLSASDVARAHDRIAQLDFIGLLEDFESSVAMLKARLELPIDRVLNRRFPNEDCEIPPSLPDRIANDNPHDMETYEFVKKLYRQRQQEAQRQAA